jgi:hypothetical protein
MQLSIFNCTYRWWTRWIFKFFIPDMNDNKL